MSREILDLEPPLADQRITYGPGSYNFGEIRLPYEKGPHPLVITIHGGFWRSAFDLNHMGHLCAELAKRGVATWNLEYRRVGHEGGGWPGTAEDVAAGAAYVEQLASDFPIDATRMVVVGYSAGGQLALWLTAHRKLKLRGAVSLAGVVDLHRAWELGIGDGAVEQFLGGSPETQPKRYAAASPINLLPFSTKTCLIHGTRDSRVPFELSKQFACAAPDCELVALEGADHFELIDPSKPECRIVQQTIVGLL